VKEVADTALILRPISCLVCAQQTWHIRKPSLVTRAGLEQGESFEELVHRDNLWRVASTHLEYLRVGKSSSERVDNLVLCNDGLDWGCECELVL
jgi:hypothetical protein